MDDTPLTETLVDKRRQQSKLSTIDVWKGERKEYAGDMKVCSITR